MAQSSNSLLNQIAVALGKDGGHAIRSDNQWLELIAGVHTPMGRNRLLQVIAGRTDNANAVACLQTITGTTVSYYTQGLEAWLALVSVDSFAILTESGNELWTESGTPIEIEH